MSGVLAGRCRITRSEYKKETYCKGWAVQAIRRTLAPATCSHGIRIVVALAIGIVWNSVRVHYLELISLVGKKSQRGKSRLDDSDEQRGGGIVLNGLPNLVKRDRRVSGSLLDC